MQHGESELPFFENQETHTLNKIAAKPCLHSLGTLIDLGEAMHCVKTKSLTNILAGYTYLGQFIAHDVTKTTNGQVMATGLPNTDIIENGTTPTLDLSCMYTEGSLSVQQAPDITTGKLLLDKIENCPVGVDQFADLPRDADKKALIPDERNDAVLMVSQLHVQFIKLHNHFVDKIKEKDASKPPERCFKEAKLQTIQIYQTVIVHDFLKTLLPDSIWQLYFGEVVDADISKFRNNPVFFLDRIPLVFKAAAFRFGHSLVRESYRINDNSGTDMDLGELFRLTGKHKLAGQDKLNYSQVVNWYRFFFSESQGKQRAKAISIAVDVDLPDEKWPAKRLSTRALFRGQSFGLPSGQVARNAVIQNANIPVKIQNRLKKVLKKLSAKELNPKVKFTREGAFLETVDSTESSRILDRVPSNNTILQNTPLWYYLLCECQSMKQEKKKKKLGGLTSFIVAETFYNLLQQNDFLKGNPEPLIKVTKMRDIIKITQPKRV